jgi:hypothetical protein
MYRRGERRVPLARLPSLLLLREKRPFTPEIHRFPRNSWLVPLVLISGIP